MLNPQLERALEERRAQSSISEQVKWILKRLLTGSRPEMAAVAREYLNRPEMDVTEVAFLLGYEDSNSFYRAFRTWEGTTPSQLRAALRRSEPRQ
jgi:AraC-like DNA-binding protein